MPLHLATCLRRVNVQETVQAAKTALLLCMQASIGGAQSAPDKPVPMNLTPQAYLHRLDSLAALQAAWSPICTLTPSDGSGIKPNPLAFTLTW